jgi:heptaprenyl diphosphate synthase
MLDGLYAGSAKQRSALSRADAPSVASQSGMGVTGRQAGRLTACLHAALAQFTGPLGESCSRIVQSPGRRLRPALTIACAGLAGAQVADSSDAHPEIMRLAAAVELLHCATLVHDDVIDGAGTRRGVATINAREGTPTAIVAGDALIAASMQLAAGVSGSAAMIMAETLSRLCAGQAGEESLRFDVTATTDQVRQVATGKSGSLLRAACLLGATAAGLSSQLVVALGRYGMAFGVCLQMVDDILDIASTPVLLGKPIGADISAGVMTGPIVDCLRTQPELAGLLGSPAGSVEHIRALRLIRASGSLEETIHTARSAAQAAGTDLAADCELAGCQLATGSAHDRVLDLAGWAARYVESALLAKLDRELVLSSPAQRRSA